MAYKNSWTNSTPADPCAVTIAPDANDFLIGWAITDSQPNGAEDSPAGWTQLYRASSTFDGATLQVSYKKADGSETSASFNSTGANTMIAGVISFSGVDTTTPLDVTPQTFTSSTSDTTTSISITPVTNGCDLVFVQGQDGATGDYSFTFSTTSGTTGAWTTRVDQNSGFFNVACGSATQTTAGALTAQVVSTTGGRLGVLFALRPVALSPTINTHPANATSYEGQTANFTVSATTSGGTLHYQWKDDGSNVGTDSNSYTTAAAVYADNGAQITCVVSDDNGSATSNAANWSVIIASKPFYLRA